jgi:hypothetical protein
VVPLIEDMLATVLSCLPLIYIKVEAEAQVGELHHEINT